MKMVLVYILLNAYYGSSERVHWFIALETIPDKVISILQELHGRTKLMPTISPLIWTCGQTVTHMHLTLNKYKHSFNGENNNNNLTRD